MGTDNITRVINKNQCIQRSNKNKGAAPNIKLFGDRKSKMGYTEGWQM